MPLDSTKIQEKKFNDLVIDWNARINIVSRKKSNIYDLINDSKLFLKHIDFREGLKIMDLGTGGGLPGIIIKIHHPEIYITLIDSIQKKINAVGDIIQKLGLENVEVICARAEELAKKPEYRKEFDYIVVRSVAPLDSLAKWSKNLVKPGAKLVTVKGADISEELLKTKRLKCVKNTEFFAENERKIVVVEFV
jgi:16S rRNA (guanine527-N7)-methyltransferase